MLNEGQIARDITTSANLFLTSIPSILKYIRCYSFFLTKYACRLYSTFPKRLTILNISPFASLHIHPHYATATLVPTKRTHHLNVRRWRSIEWQRRRLRPKLAHEDNNVRPAHAQQTTLVYVPKYTYEPHAWPRQSMTGPRSHIARQAAANLVSVNFSDTSIVRSTDKMPIRWIHLHAFDRYESHHYYVTGSKVLACSNFTCIDLD
jgi:hypothetical protein